MEGWMLGGSGSAWRKATKHSALGHATKSLLGPHFESTFTRLDGPILHANFVAPPFGARRRLKLLDSGRKRPTKRKKRNLRKKRCQTARGSRIGATSDRTPFRDEKKGPTHFERAPKTNRGPFEPKCRAKLGPRPPKPPVPSMDVCRSKSHHKTDGKRPIRPPVGGEAWGGGG